MMRANPVAGKRLSDQERGSRSGREQAEAVLEQAKAAGATEIFPVAEEHGWLLGRVADPFGHHWEIGKPLFEWPPRPVGAGQPDESEQA